MFVKKDGYALAEVVTAPLRQGWKKRWLNRLEAGYYNRAQIHDMWTLQEYYEEYKIKFASNDQK
jgi:hypothetical protein